MKFDEREIWPEDGGKREKWPNDGKVQSLAAREDE
jgi:hypothetical protein